MELTTALFSPNAPAATKFQQQNSNRNKLNIQNTDNTILIKE
jgi:hypothetical protein